MTCGCRSCFPDTVVRESEEVNEGKGETKRSMERERERGDRGVPAEGEKDERDGVVKGRFNKIKETRSYQNLYDTNAEK